ncbi:oxidoreductase-like protein [Colletotrichum tofieldiae]|nr:oxidoreductase-like protein [Colletotrichum tofieldiae]
MGLFSSFQSEETRRAEEVRTGARAPDRSERRKCWDARDAYFGCLDRNTIVDAVKDDDKARKACPPRTPSLSATAPPPGCVSLLLVLSFATSTYRVGDRDGVNPNAQSGSTNALPARQVKYFKQWRVADIQKKQRIAQLEAENAIKMDVTTTFADQTAAPPTKGATSKGDLQDMLASRRK